MKIIVPNYTISDEDIISISVDRNIDEMSLTLPIDELHTTVRMGDDKVNFFRWNTHIAVVDDEKIWRTSGFYAREIKKKGYNMYEIYGVSSVGLLADRNFPGKMFLRGAGYPRWTFGEAVEAITRGKFEYTFGDNKCKDFEVEGWIGHCSQREAIRHLCLAAGVTAFMGVDGKLCFRTSVSEPSFERTTNTLSLQQHEVLDDYTLSEGVQYSHYSYDMYTFSTDPNRGDEYITDPNDGKIYYYSVEKRTGENLNFPKDQPENELYIQGEMMLTRYSPHAESLIERLSKYYSGALTLEFKAVTEEEPDSYIIGFFDGDKMIYGYPSKISTSYGRNRVTEFVCDMAFTQNAKFIVLNYINSAGDLLATRKLYKGNEFVTKTVNPVIVLRFDNRHKAVYMADEYITEIDDSSGTITSVNIPCTAALIQNGDVLKINAVDKADQSNDSLTIGGKRGG